MKRSQAQQKAELLAEAEVLIDALSEWDEQTSKPNLKQIEDEVLELRRRFGQRLSETVTGIRKRSNRQKRRSVRSAARGCATKGKKKRTSRVG